MIKYSDQKRWILERVQEVMDNAEKCTDMCITIKWSSSEVPLIRYEIDEVVWKTEAELEEDND